MYQISDLSDYQNHLFKASKKVSDYAFVKPLDFGAFKQMVILFRS